MVKFRPRPQRRRDASRSVVRRHVHYHMRRLNRPCLRNLPGYRRGPDDLSEAITAMNRAIRAHRRLAKLAPEIFDSTEVNRLAHRRRQDAEWQAVWEPALIEVYGPSPPKDSHRDPLADQPQLPRCVLAPAVSLSANTPNGNSGWKPATSPKNATNNVGLMRCHHSANWPDSSMPR